jgi:hypothetical protein
MLKFLDSEKAFQRVQPTEMKSEGIVERYDLQKSIVNSWDLFKNEIGLPSAFLVGEEVRPHESTQNAIDLLAFDPDDSSLIVIELKRDRHKLHLLQSLSYAAMVFTWDTDTLMAQVQPHTNPDYQELLDLIKDNEINPEVKIILVAEYYDPEVILTADWLSTRYGVNISIFSVAMHRLGTEMFLTVEQRYPLKGLKDTYEERSQNKRSKKVLESVSWDEVLPKLDYSFAQRGIELCSKIKIGEPSRRRFGSIRSNFDGFTWISLNFRQKYINVYMRGDFEGAQDHLQSKFAEDVSIGTWKNGYSILITTEQAFEDLVRWLKL